MKTRTFLKVSPAIALSFLTSVALLVSTSLAQENQTNMTAATNETNAMMGNQTESGTASGIENLTGGSSGNIGLLQNDTDIGSQNTSVTGGMEQEQEATETSNMTSQQQQNETGVMMGNETNQTGEGGNETQQGPLEQLRETLSGIFGGGNQSQ
ncbi:MAG TPA: hypothetical protein VHH33_08640 [Nitrososphaeraceae archaeon]|jgi:hypothetical protein|nr:hypothetical protein [Nitrososphaeraceae archaeon]